MDVERSMLIVECSKSKNHQVIAMHEFHAREFFSADFLGAEFRNPARKFHSIQIADTHNIAG
jgi:hypothetical protein